MSKEIIYFYTTETRKKLNRYKIMKSWSESQIEYWEEQSDSDFLNYFKPVINDIEKYNNLNDHDLYVYKRYKRIIRSRKIDSIIENRILNFNQFDKFF